MVEKLAWCPSLFDLTTIPRRRRCLFQLSRRTMSLAISTCQCCRGRMLGYPSMPSSIGNTRQIPWILSRGVSLRVLVFTLSTLLLSLWSTNQSKFIQVENALKGDRFTWWISFCSLQPPPLSNVQYASCCRYTKYLPTRLLLRTSMDNNICDFTTRHNKKMVKKWKKRPFNASHGVLIYPWGTSLIPFHQALTPWGPTISNQTSRCARLFLFSNLFRSNGQRDHLFFLFFPFTASSYFNWNVIKSLHVVDSSQLNLIGHLLRIVGRRKIFTLFLCIVRF